MKVNSRNDSHLPISLAAGQPDLANCAANDAEPAASAPSYARGGPFFCALRNRRTVSPTARSIVWSWRPCRKRYSVVESGTLARPGAWRSSRCYPKRTLAFVPGRSGPRSASDRGSSAIAAAWIGVCRISCGNSEAPPSRLEERRGQTAGVRLRTSHFLPR